MHPPTFHQQTKLLESIVSYLFRHETPNRTFVLSTAQFVFCGCFFVKYLQTIKTNLSSGEKKMCRARAKLFSWSCVKNEWRSFFEKARKIVTLNLFECANNESKEMSRTWIRALWIICVIFHAKAVNGSDKKVWDRLKGVKVNCSNNFPGLSTQRSLNPAKNIPKLRLLALLRKFQNERQISQS